jgi:hypothetical protein
MANAVDQFLLVENGCVSIFPGDLLDYRTRVLPGKAKDTQTSDVGVETASEKTVTRPGKEIRQLKKRLNTLDGRMERLQRKLAEVEQRLSDPAIYQNGDGHEKQQVDLQSMLRDQEELKQQSREKNDRQKKLSFQLKSHSDVCDDIFRDENEPESVSPPQVKRCEVFEPQSPRRMTWDCFLALLILYSVAVVPYRLAFEVPAEGAWFVLELCMDFMFLVDIVLNFNTAFYNKHDQLVRNRAEIVKHYLQMWFWIELASTIPLQLLDDSLGQLKSFRVLRVIRVMKLARLLKLSLIFDRLEDEDVLNPNVMRLAKLLLYIFFIAHLVCCFYFWCTSSDTININFNFNNNDTNRWPEDKGIDQMLPVFKYAWTMYWSVMLLTTVG